MNSKNNNLTEHFFGQAVISVLKELKKNNLQDFIDLISIPVNVISNKFGWLKSENSLSIFYTLLINYKLIFCEWEFFKNHFIGSESVNEKIKWLFNLNELVVIFQYLRDQNIISEVSNPHQLLCENFLDRYGNSLKAGSLRTLLEKGVRSPEREYIIREIIEEIVKNSQLTQLTVVVYNNGNHRHKISD